VSLIKTCTDGSFSVNFNSASLKRRSVAVGTLSTVSPDTEREMTVGPCRGADGAGVLGVLIIDRVNADEGVALEGVAMLEGVAGVEGVNVG
jgi:hypothetical protein